MPDQSHASLNRQEVERIAHEALGRQLRLMMGMSAILLVLGFVVGQFTGASLARRNTDRLQARIEQLEQTLVGVEFQLDERRDEHAELEQAFVRIEDQRRDEIGIDRASLAGMINVVEDTRAAIHGDLDVFDVRQRTLPAAQVRQIVDRFASEQVRSLQQLLTSQTRRLELPDDAGPSASWSMNRAPEPAHGPATDHGPSRHTRREATLSTETGNVVPPPPAEPLRTPRAEPLRTPRAEPLRTPPAEPPRTASTGAAEPPACRPRPELLVESDVPATADASDVPATAPVSDEPWVAPPRRRGYLFFSPSQPRRMDPSRVSDSESIPLPPR